MANRGGGGNERRWNIVLVVLAVAGSVGVGVTAAAAVAVDGKGRWGRVVGRSVGR